MQGIIKISKNKVRLYLADLSPEEQEVMIKLIVTECRARLFPESQVPPPEKLDGGYSAEGLVWHQPSWPADGRATLVMEFWSDKPDRILETANTLVPVLYMDVVLDPTAPLPPIINPETLADREYITVGDNKISNPAFLKLMRTFISQRMIYADIRDSVTPGLSPDTAARHRDGLFGLGSALLSSKVYKENIVENTIDSLDVLKQLEIVEFDYKDVDKKHHIGVIVEDSPDILCAEEGDRLDIVNVVGVLLDANKKLLERVEALEEVL